MRRAILASIGIVLFATGMIVVSLSGGRPANAYTQAADPSRCNAVTPIGALAPARPIFCNDLSDSEINDTFMNMGNMWVDDWAGNTGTVNAALPTAYRTFTTDTDPNNVRYFRHNDHWMVDVWHQPGAREFTFMRPDRTFTADPAEGGNLVVDTEAAIISSYGNLGAWPELVVTTGPGAAQPDPVGRTNGPTYGYEWFPNAYTLGCRFQADGNIICSVMDETNRGAGGGGRIMEIGQWHCPDGSAIADPCPDGSHVTQSGASQIICNGPVDPDTTCRNHYRLVIRPDGFMLYVNGVASTGVTNLGPQYRAAFAALLGGPTYTWNSSDVLELIDGTVQAAGTPDVRFHWDHFAVNPDAMGVTATPTAPAPTATAVPPTSSPTPTATATAISTPTATNTPQPSPTPRPTATSQPATYRCQRQNANGTFSTLWTRQGGGSCP